MLLAVVQNKGITVVLKRLKSNVFLKEKKKVSKLLIKAANLLFIEYTPVRGALSITQNLFTINAI